MARPVDFAVSDHAGVQAQLDRLAALSLPQGRIGLEPIRELLERLGHPERALPPVFHVAGTNGKGSTCAFLRAALEAAGKRVHVFTSPHLVRFNERIRVAGTLIEDALLASLLAQVLDEAEAGQIAVSFFEVATAAAFLAFAQVPADACVIEVGLGGRLDATNVLDAPVSCGIASLGIDHEAFLLAPEAGTPAEPVARIAFEKAGIAKPAVPLVTLDYERGAVDAIEEQAERVIAPVFREGRDWSIRARGDALFYRDHHGDVPLPLPALAGQHQISNAGLAIAMLRHQDALVVEPEALAQAMAEVRWPARMQRLAAGPLTERLPAGTPCWLDGGHNPDAGRALGHHFAGAGPGEEAPIHLVIGMLANKNPAALVEPLRRHLASVTVVPVPGHEHHGLAPFRALHPDAVAASDVGAALAALAPAAGEVVLIAGSLYLAGSVLALNRQLPD